MTPGTELRGERRAKVGSGGRRAGGREVGGREGREERRGGERRRRRSGEQSCFNAAATGGRRIARGGIVPLRPSCVLGTAGLGPCGRWKITTGFGAARRAPARPHGRRKGIAVKHVWRTEASRASSFYDLAQLVLVRWWWHSFACFSCSCGGRRKDALARRYLAHPMTESACPCEPLPPQLENSTFWLCCRQRIYVCYAAVSLSSREMQTLLRRYIVTVLRFLHSRQVWCAEDWRRLGHPYRSRKCG